MQTQMDMDIEYLVQRIVEYAKPVRIILFGSAARGDQGPDSDVDLLIVMPDGTHRRKTAQALYRQLWGIGFPKDILVVTESDLKEHAHNPAMVIHVALEEGREVYRAAG